MSWHVHAAVGVQKAQMGKRRRGRAEPKLPDQGEHQFQGRENLSRALVAVV